MSTPSARCRAHALRRGVGAERRILVRTPSKSATIGLVSMKKNSAVTPGAIVFTSV